MHAHLDVCTPLPASVMGSAATTRSLATIRTFALCCCFVVVDARCEGAGSSFAAAAHASRLLVPAGEAASLTRALLMSLSRGSASRDDGGGVVGAWWLWKAEEECCECIITDTPSLASMMEGWWCVLTEGGHSSMISECMVVGCVMSICVRACCVCVFYMEALRAMQRRACM